MHQLSHPSDRQPPVSFINSLLSSDAERLHRRHRHPSRCVAMAEVIFGSDRRHPIIDPSPTPSKILKNFRSSDWRNAALATAVSLPYGYWAGRPVLMMPTMAVSGLLGATFGLALGWQMSFGRLTGLNENAREVAMYGPESSDINNKSS